MRLLEGFTLLYRDPQRVPKVLWASLFFGSTLCIPLVGQLVLTGWAAMTLRDAAWHPGAPPRLARLTWDPPYLQELTAVGLRVTIATLAWLLPWAAAWGLLFFFPLVAAVVGGLNDAPSGGHAPYVVVALGTLGVPVLLTGQLFGLAAGARVAATDWLSSAFEWREVLHMVRLTWGRVLLHMLAVGVMSGFLTLLGMLLCCVGWLPAVAVSVLAQSMLHHVLYAAHVEAGGTPLAVVPPCKGAFDDAEIDPAVFA